MAKSAKKSGSAKKSKSAAKSSSASAGTKKGALTLIMEGDSWFNLPDFWSSLPIVGGVDNDLARALAARGHHVTNLAYWGHTIAQMAAAREWRGFLEPGKRNLLLLSGGGNDLLGTKFGNVGLLRDCLNQKPSGDDPEPSYYLNHVYDDRLDAVLRAYAAIIGDVVGTPGFSKTRIFVHGYDYAVDKELAWVGQPMNFRNIPVHRRAGIIALITDRFNTRLKSLAAGIPAVTYIDLRNTVGPDRWHDEIHPRKAVFDELAAKVEKAVRKAIE